MSGQTGLRARGLSYAVEGRALLDGLDLEVERGASAAVVGPSGSGKSTLLMCLLGLIKPDAGRVTVEGQELGRLSGRGLAAFRRERIGIVFQFGELLPELSPTENVALAGLLAGMERREAYEKAEQLLAGLGVPAEGTATGQLSGGERQRTAVARALIGDPTLILADEPTGALDQTARDAVADLLFKLPAERGCALVVVTHDHGVAARADRCLRLDDGRLVEAAR
ncbi:ABC transporter ATP-binding protein [Actinocorallia longicatena]|uniref:ABC transporter ATP-binding protein n=1 Tax=Actinocorallia longicatena TaxID=111803 RepID=A0ABP6Q016_9ACTN